MNKTIAGTLLLIGFSTLLIAADKNWVPAKIDQKKNTIIFPNGKTLTGNLYETTYFGLLSTKKKAPYLILGGRGCEDCDIETSLYIHSPDDGPIQPASSQKSFSYPGKLLGNSANGEVEGAVLDQTRVFFGNCIEGNRNAVVWFQHLNNASKKSVFVVSVDTEDRMTEKSITENVPALSYTTQKVKAGMCTEIPPMDQMGAP